MRGQDKREQLGFFIKNDYADDTPKLRGHSECSEESQSETLRFAQGDLLGRITQIMKQMITQIEKTRLLRLKPRLHRFLAESILTLILVLILTLTSTLVSTAEGAWLASDWKKRLPITINNSGATLTDYQVWIPTSVFSSEQWAEIKGGTGKANLDDVRFTMGDGVTHLNYWIDYNTTTPKGFWVKVDSAPAGTSTIYLYYGNQNANKGSNGDRTFIFFDDFETDLSRWEQIKTNPTAVIQRTTSKVYEGAHSVEVNQFVDDGEDTILSRSLPLMTGVIEMMFYDDTVRVSTGIHSLGPGDLTARVNSYRGSKYFWPQWTDTGISRSTGWHHFKFVFTGSEAKIYIDFQFGGSTTTAGQFSSVQINSGWSVSGPGLYQDLVKVRQYVSSEPSVSVGSAESGDSTAPVYSETSFRHKNSSGIWLDSSGWNNTTSVEVKCEVQDSGSGLRIGQSELVASSGTVLLMHLNEGSSSPRDTSGYGNNASTITASWTASGKFGQALNFDGLDDCVTIPDAEPLNPSGQITLSAWAKVASETSPATRPLISKNEQYVLALSADGKVGGYVFVNGAYRGAVSTGSAQISANNWHHFALTYDGSYIRYYLDGRLQSAIAQSGSLNVTTNPLYIGSWMSTPVLRFYGNIDEVRIAKRALSAEEIAVDYNSGCVKYSTNGGNTWTIEPSPAVAKTTGADGTTAVQISTAVAIPLVQSTNFNEHPSRVKFIIQDMAGNIAESSAYHLKIDTTPPTDLTLSCLLVSSTSQVVLQAQVQDPLSGIQTSSAYWFEEISGNSGGSSSLDWQNSSFIDSGLFPNTAYTYQVKARDTALNTSAYSLTVSTVTLANPPTGIYVSSVTSSGIVINWSSNGNPSWTNYIVEISSVSPFSPFTSYSTTLLNRSIAGLSPDVRYYLRVKAVNRSGRETLPTQTVTGTTLATVPILSGISNATTNSVRINWETDNSPQTEYFVEIARDNNFQVDYTSSGWIANLSADFGGLTSNSTYYYRVKARNGNLIETTFTTTNKFVTLTGSPSIGSSSHSTGEWTNNPSFVSYGGGSDHYHTRFNQVSGDEPLSTDEYWSGSPKVFLMSKEGDWYLHIRGENSGNSLCGFDHFGPIKLDTSPPNITILHLTTLDGTTLTSNSTTTSNTVNFTWTEPASLSPISGYSVSISSFDHEPSETVQISTTFYHYTAPTEGKYYFRLKAKDLAGNWGDSTLFVFWYSPEKVLLDTTSPQVANKDLKTKNVGSNGDKILISTKPVFSVFFDEPMDEKSLGGAVVLKAVEKNGGTKTNLIITGTVTYEPAEKKLNFTPQESLPAGWTFELTVSTKAKDTSGNPLLEILSEEFSTPMDCDVENVITSGIDLTGIRISTGAILKNWFVEIDTDPALETVLEANTKLAESPDYRLIPGTLRMFKLYDALGDLLSEEEIKEPLTVTVPYPDGNKDGIVDGLTPPVKVEDLNIFYLDEVKNIWMRLPSTVKKDLQVVTAEVEHLSLFTIGEYKPKEKAPLNNGEVFAYPVPWRPNSGDASKYGTEAQGITFANLTSPSTIKIYDLAGEMVKIVHSSLFIVEGSGWKYVWNCADDSGKKVQSGVYIYIVESSSGKKSGKLMIIR